MGHMNMELIYEYGSRDGFWRLHRLFTERSVPVTGSGQGAAPTILEPVSKGSVPLRKE